MIDNFKEIEKFLDFEEGYFYKFECLVRNTDGENSLYYEGMSNSNKNLLIKNWYVDTKEYYQKIKHEMMTLCDMTGGRLYLTLDRKSNKKLLQELLKGINNKYIDYTNGCKTSIKSITKLFSSKTSVKEVSDKEHKTIMFDIDTKDNVVLECIKNYVLNNGLIPYILETKKGYHLFCYRKDLNLDNWEIKTSDLFIQIFRNTVSLEVAEKLLHELVNNVTVNPNQLALIYLP